MARGGTRKGAGRPHGTIKTGNKKRINIRIKPNLIEWLKRQPLGISPTVEKLIETEIERPKKIKKCCDNPLLDFGITNPGGICKNCGNPVEFD